MVKVLEDWEANCGGPWEMILETRMTTELAFNENDYLALHPDVAAAVKAGAFKSGRDHFEKFGRSEGRAFISNNVASDHGLHWAETISSMRSLGSAPCIDHPPSDLVQFFDERRTGPGIWKWRHYFPVYERHLAKFRGQEIHFLEIGIYSGGSLDMWRAYLGPRAYIYGVDIEPSCKAYERDRTSVFIGDQADPKFWADFRQQVPILDAVLDDGGHRFHQQVTTVNELLPHLRPGGVFLCEDIHGQTNPFAAYVAGMIKVLNDTKDLASTSDDDERRLANPTNNFQKAISSICFYPFITALERNSAQPTELIAPKHGDSWQPFLK